MPLVPAVMKKKMEAALIAAFNREFPDAVAQNPSAVASYQKQAAAISDIALVIVEELLASAQVSPGIATAGSPSAQTSVSPGKIT